MGVRSCKNAFSRCCGWVCVRSVHAYAFLNACAHVGMRVVCVRDRPKSTTVPPTRGVPVGFPSAVRLRSPLNLKVNPLPGPRPASLVSTACLVIVLSIHYKKDT